MSTPYSHWVLPWKAAKGKYQTIYRFLTSDQKKKKMLLGGRPTFLTQWIESFARQQTVKVNSCHACDFRVIMGLFIKCSSFICNVLYKNYSMFTYVNMYSMYILIFWIFGLLHFAPLKLTFYSTLSPTPSHIIYTLIILPFWHVFVNNPLYFLKHNGFLHTHTLLNHSIQ